MQTNNPYIEVKVPREKEEELINFLYMLGFDRFAYKKDKFIYNIIDNNNPYLFIECFFVQKNMLDEQKSRLTERFSAMGVKSDLQIYYKNFEDWESQYKSSFKAVELAGGYYAVPEWLDEWEHESRILIEPGMAFGTGHHFTTRSICFFITQTDFLNDRFVVDLGSGSSLVSIFASKLRAPSVIAVEKDRLSIKNAIKNIMLNDADTNIFLIQSDILQLPFRLRNIYKYFINIDYDIVTEFLCRFINEIPVTSKLLVSGILNREKQEFEQAVVDYGLKIRAVASDGEWISVSTEKR